MRRSKGMTFIEVITAMLVTLIIGGSSALFLKSGLDMERVNTISATNQQSLRTPFLELTPLVERANALEILPALPNRSDLKPGEIVAYVADPKDSNKLAGKQNNMYLRTWEGDRLVPGFSQIAEFRFEKSSVLPSGTPLTSEDQAVRLIMTAKDSGIELVYSADIRSLNRVAVEGTSSGAFLKIDTRDNMDLYPFMSRARWRSLSGSFERVSLAGALTLAQTMRVVGNFLVFSGTASSDFEYEWRLANNAVARNAVMAPSGYKVIGKDFLQSDPQYAKHYDNRFRKATVPSAGIPSSSIGLSGSGEVRYHTGTTAVPPKTYDDSLAVEDVLQLAPSMRGKHLVFAVRQRGSESWAHTGSYLIEKNPIPESLFFKELKDDVDKDKKNNTKNTLFDGIQNAGVALVTGNNPATGVEGTYLELSGSGVDGRPFLSKELTPAGDENRYFGGKRQQEFCLENYTIWMDAVLEEQSTSGWTFLLNSNVIKKQVPPGTGNNRPGDQAYGYGFQFDPGMEFAGLTSGFLTNNANAPYFVQKSLNKPIANGQGVIIRRFVGSTNTDPEGISAIRRWKEKTTTPQAEGPGKSFYSLYYLWSDVAYRGGPRPVPDPHDLEAQYGITYGDSFAIKNNAVASMRNARYVTQINVITQTKKSAGKTLPERIFCRVRVYDQGRKYDDDNEDWLFPRGTGRSKDMWFGLASDGELLPLYWGLPINQAVSSTTGALTGTFERGDVAYALKDMANTVINNKDNPGYSGRAIGKTWGLRIWGGKLKANIYSINITEGLPLDYKLPWTKRNGQPLTVKEAMGQWDPVKPYELQD